MRWLLLLWASCVFAQDVQLKGLRKTLLPMRDREATAEGRGFPELTTAKHQLRDWIESRLATFPSNGDRGEFARQLNRELEKAGFFDDTDDLDSEGSIGGVELHDSTQGLVVQTSVGIDCGFDESAYIYHWTGDRWTRIWETEQNDYRKDSYTPQYLEVGTSRDLVVTRGVNPACMSAWQGAYFRVWQRSGDQFRLIIDRAEPIYLGDREMRMAVNDGNVLVEYDTYEISPVDHHRRAVLHWQIDPSGTYQRIDPIALSPQTFVSEWYSRRWEEMSAWTEGGTRLRQKHDPKPGLDSYGQVLHCPSQPDLYQVAATRLDEDADIYFLVRWKPPYRFSMVDIRTLPDPRCTEPAPEADRDATLFP